jgi:DNA-binding transcriptional MocR family regulator
MRIALQRDAGAALPVYRQIAAQIRRQIDEKQLVAGARLPAIRDLARRLEVHRDTVALAYEELASAGVVESTVGRGTFVRGNGGGNGAAHPEPSLRFAPAAERLLELERARPRFGTADDAISMHTLVPDPSLYPAESFRRVLNRVLSEGGAPLLLYGGPQGHPRMREVMAERLRAAGIEIPADGILLCHGASQGISLALRLFADTGDVVALEEPTYQNVLTAATGLGLRTAAVPMREDGADLAALERTLARPEVKAFYTIPTFHNPLGTTTRLAHRQQLLAIAARAGKPVIEDGYEADLRLSGRPVPALAALDSSGLVVHLASFSKSLFPGVRAGVIAARGRAVAGLLALKQASDLSDSMPLQAALAEFVAEGEYDRHLARLRRTLLGRRDALLAALGEQMPPGTRWNSPEGGYQVWVELPEAIDTRDLLADAVGAGVLFAPGSQFHHDGRPSHCLRLSFAMEDEARLRQGVAALGRLIAARLAAAQPRAEAVHI